MNVKAPCSLTVVGKWGVRICRQGEVLQNEFVGFVRLNSAQTLKLVPQFRPKTLLFSKHISDLSEQSVPRYRPLKSLRTWL